MNSIKYLSRQLNGSPVPKTHSSSSEAGPFISDLKTQSSHRENALRRVKTWSSKAFLFPIPSSHNKKPGRRSFSSPPDFFHINPMQHRSSASATIDASKNRLESTLRVWSFTGLFMSLWRVLCRAWLSMTRHYRTAASRETSVEAGSETDDKESEEDETSDEKLASDQQPPPIRSPLSSIDMPPIPTSASIVTGDEVHMKLDSQALRHSQSTPPSSSRSSTPPAAPARKAPFLIPKTLVLDLDETLIHSTTRPMDSVGSSTNLLGLNTFRRRNKSAGHTVEVAMAGRSQLLHVYKRPFADFFLRTVRSICVSQLIMNLNVINRFLDGIRLLFLPHQCKNTPTRSLIGLTLAAAYYQGGFSETYVPYISRLGFLSELLSFFFWQSCTQLPNGMFTKDLTVVEQDLSRVCLVDNSPISYRVNEGEPISFWKF
jgi:CTD nuclear envelope phosphatase 1